MPDDGNWPPVASQEFLGLRVPMHACALAPGFCDTEGLIWVTCPICNGAVLASQGLAPRPMANCLARYWFGVYCGTQTADPLDIGAAMLREDLESLVSLRGHVVLSVGFSLPVEEVHPRQPTGA